MYSVPFPCTSPLGFSFSTNSWGKSTINSSCRRAGRQKAESAGPTSYYAKTALFLPHQCPQLSSYISLYSPQHSETIQLHLTPAIRPHLGQHISPQGPNHWLRAPSIHGTFGQGIFGAADRTQSSKAPTLHTSDLSKNDTRPEFSQKQKENFSLLKSGSQKRDGKHPFNHLNWKLNVI